MRSTQLFSPLSCVVQGSGPGLLLCHGAGGSISSNFGALLSPLAEHFTVVAPDYPGSGDTPRATKSLQLDELADQLVAAASAAGVEKFAILSFSLGCAVAIRATIRHPDRIAALVLTAGFARLDTASYIRASSLLMLAKKGEKEVLSRFLVGSLVSERFLGKLSEEQREAFIRKAAGAIPEGFAEQMDLAMRVDVRGDLPRLSLPTLVIRMAREHLVSPWIGKLLSESIPGAVTAELDSGHFPIDCRQEWLHLIQDFLIATEAVA